MDVVTSSLASVDQFASEGTESTREVARIMILEQAFACIRPCSNVSGGEILYAVIHASLWSGVTFRDERSICPGLCAMLTSLFWSHGDHLEASQCEAGHRGYCSDRGDQESQHRSRDHV